MGIINTAVVEKGLQLVFDKGYAEILAGTYNYRNEVQRLFTNAPSRSASEKYFFLQDYPSVREWLGEKHFASLEDADYTILNKDWEVSVSIFKNELEDDQYGAIKDRIALMPRALVDHKADLLVSLLQDGTTDLAYDGSAFFANRTSPNDNLLAGSGITASALQTDLASVRTAMRLFESNNGKKLGLVPNMVICPAALESVMFEAIYSLSDVGGNEKANPLKEWYSGGILVLPELDEDDATDWFAVCTNHPLKPFIWQERERPTFHLLDNDVHINKQYYATAEARHNAGYALPQLAIKVVNS